MSFLWITVNFTVYTIYADIGRQHEFISMFWKQYGAKETHNIVYLTEFSLETTTMNEQNGA